MPTAHPDVRVETDVPLGPLTWYGVGGCAKVLAHPRSEAALARLVRDGHERGQRLYVLGAGANLLVRDCGVDGVVIRLDEPAFAQLHIAGGLATVGAGYDLFKLVRELAKAGLAGLETVAGIPASVGGAVRMNAGGAFGEIGACVDRLRVMEQQINAQDKLSDEDKVNLQQYITRIYGSLTTFNVLFKYKEDQFKGASKPGGE